MLEWFVDCVMIYEVLLDVTGMLLCFQPLWKQHVFIVSLKLQRARLMIVPPCSEAVVEVAHPLSCKQAESERYSRGILLIISSCSAT